MCNLCENDSMALCQWDDMKYEGNIMARGAGSADKSILINTTLTRLSINKYRLKITMKGRSTQTWNSYGQRVYAHIGSNKIKMGDQIVKDGVFQTTSSYTYDFTITKDTAVYASTACVYCDDTKHTGHTGSFANQTTKDTAVYEVEYTAPSNALVSLDKSGIAEGNVKATASYSCAKPSGITYFRFRYQINGGTWVTSDWSTTKTYTINVTNLKRGGTFGFQTSVKNSVGTSSWSGTKTIIANSLPTAPSNLSVNTTRPTGSVTLSWNGSTDANNQTLTYEVFLKKASGSFASLGTTTGKTLAYNTTSDAQGTRYVFYVNAKDTLGASTKSGNSNTFYKATAPSSPVISLDKSGTVEGAVKATASYTCNYSVGTIQYRFAYRYDGVNWSEQGWSTINSFSIDTAIYRGKTWEFRVKVKNDAGESAWSTTKTVVSNSAPTPPTGLSFGTLYPISNTTLSWVRSADAENQTIIYKVYLQKNGGTYSLISTGTSNSIAHDFSCDPEGTRYRFKVEAYDSFNLSSSSQESVEVFKPMAPSDITFLLPSENIKENNFEVRWSSSNFQGLKGTYTVEKSINFGEWVSAISNTPLTAFTFDISSIERGDIVQFRVKAMNEAGQVSNSTTTGFVRRNRVPDTVSNIQPSSTYCMNIITFSWNEAGEPDGQDVRYKLYIQKNDKSYSYLGETTKTSYRWSVPGSDIGETLYRLKIEAHDPLGAYSTSYGPALKKPTAPSEPSNLGPKSIYYEGSVKFTWTASDFHNQTGHYEIMIYIDGTLHGTVTSHINYYDFDLSGIKRGAVILYKVKAVNSFMQESKWVSSQYDIKHNRVPQAPNIIYPVNGSTLCSNMPKIVIKTGIEHDEQQMIAYVKYDDITLNSRDNTDCFSKDSLDSNEYIIFKPNNPLSLGEHTLQVYTSDGLATSENCSVNILISRSIENVNSGTYVAAEQCNDIISAINSASAAMQSADTFIQSVAQGKEIVLASHINNMISVLEEIERSIDSYHPNNKFAYDSSYEYVDKNVSLIESKHFNQLSKSLNRL